jgi:type IV pilus assembly protein PilB
MAVEEPTLELEAAAVPSPAGRAARSRLGELLVRSGDISPAQLTHALAQQRQLRMALGKVLLKLNYVTDERMRQALSTQLNVPYIDLEKMDLDPGLARIINRGYARRHSLVPVAQLGRTLTVAMDDPTAQSVIDELSRLTRFSITVVTASTRAIHRAFARLYDEAPETVEPATAELITPVDRGPEAIGSFAVDEHTARKADELFRLVLFRAVEARASDLHLEMLPRGLQIRYRIDGVLQRPQFAGLQGTLDKSMREVISRVKILSRLDIAERRRPQDGSFQVVVERDNEKVHIDLRVSVIPTHSGESVVIRILDRARAPRSLDDLDLAPGVVSGKSTTLYSCLMKLHRPGIRILTAEDPVEYVYDELSQSEVNTGIGNTFSAYLRAFLRHDPEVIMVGEIRDEDTAEMAFRAAQTGHLLLSTMHTNDAVSAVSRLLDLKVESTLVGSSLIGVLSQRLVRRNCQCCAEPFTPTAAEIADLFGAVPAGVTFKRGLGCASCAYTGYRGRMLVADLWVPDAQDTALIARMAPFGDLAASAVRTTLSMSEDAYARLVDGRTTPAELLRVLPYPVISTIRARSSSSPVQR